MPISMDEHGLDSISKVQAFLTSIDGTVRFDREAKGYGNRQKLYDWITTVLVRLRYDRATKHERSIILSYLETMTPLSRDRLKKLARHRKKKRKLIIPTDNRHSFPAKYGPSDIALLAKTDNAHGRISGDATKEILRREYELFGKAEYQRIAGISISHLYNLRNHSRQYKSASLTVRKTRSVQVPIGIRKKPVPEGKPGYLRVDSVHQGDRDKEKGVYHINLIDEVTQWEILMCVEGIAEYFLEPVLAVALDLFPFVIRNFHSDNGSEYINGTVAKLLKGLLVKQTKSRSRRTNDQALVEGKNCSRVRKHMGSMHIPKKHARAINQFYRDHMDEYCNYHRPCSFATDVVDSKGKVTKKYDTFMTPYQKLCSLENYAQYLKPGITKEALAKLAIAQSDNECAEKMQEAKRTLFNTFTKC